MSACEILEKIGYRYKTCKTCRFFKQGDETHMHDCLNEQRRNYGIKEFGVLLPVTSEEMSCKYWEEKKYGIHNS